MVVEHENVNLTVGNIRQTYTMVWENRLIHYKKYPETLPKICGRKTNFVFINVSLNFRYKFFVRFLKITLFGIMHYSE